MIMRTIATKADLNLLRQEITTLATQSDLAELRQECVLIRKDVELMAARLKSDLVLQMGSMNVVLAGPRGRRPDERYRMSRAIQIGTDYGRRSCNSWCSRSERRRTLQWVVSRQAALLSR